jgi:hypothetical protein
VSEEIACVHVSATALRRVCAHLLAKGDQTYVARFTGSGADYELLCEACSESVDQTGVPARNICAQCFSNLEDEQWEYWSRVIGQPTAGKGQPA